MLDERHPFPAMAVNDARLKGVQGLEEGLAGFGTGGDGLLDLSCRQALADTPRGNRLDLPFRFLSSLSNSCRRKVLAYGLSRNKTALFRKGFFFWVKGLLAKG
jgi:hypothetical protein